MSHATWMTQRFPTADTYDILTVSFHSKQNKNLLAPKSLLTCDMWRETEALWLIDKYHKLCDVVTHACVSLEHFTRSAFKTRVMTTRGNSRMKWSNLALGWHVYPTQLYKYMCWHAWVQAGRCGKVRIRGRKDAVSAVWIERHLVSQQRRLPQSRWAQSNN